MTAARRPPIRVVFFGGAYLQPSALQFVAMLEAHTDVDLVLGLCESEGFGFSARWRNLYRRRGVTAPVVMTLEAVESLGRLLRQPRQVLHVRRDSSVALRRFVTVPQIHAPEALEHVRAARPDLGVVYGAPLLRPELFEIPALGTLGIHHGRVPQYRGKKTTFWEMYHGERVAGVTIQRLGTGIDTGDVLRTGEVEIGRKSYSRVWREVEELGCHLFLQAVLDMRAGTARAIPQDASIRRGPLYKQPHVTDILTLWKRRLLGGKRAGSGTRSS